MGAKSRGNFQVNGCIRPCANRNKKCKDCWRFDQFEPVKERAEDAA